MYVCSSQGNKEGDEEMKYGRNRTLRGQVTVAGGVARANLIVSDGLVNLGLKINKFQTWNSLLPDGSGNRFHTSILSLDTISSGSAMNAGDNRQFAWAMSVSYTHLTLPTN